MRHGDKNNNLGRTMEHRKAMFGNMSNSLIEHKRIQTTVQKAKALRKYFEPLVTRAKDNTTHSRRIVFGHLQSKEAIKELFGPIAAAVGDRPGGYVRIIRTGFRHGDAAEMAIIELVDFNPDYNGQSKADDSKSKKRRTRRSGASKGTATATVAAPIVVALSKEAKAAEEEPLNDVVLEANDLIEDAQIETAAAPVAAVVAEAKVAEEEVINDVVEEANDVIEDAQIETATAPAVAVVAEAEVAEEEAVNDVVEEANDVIEDAQIDTDGPKKDEE